MQARPRHDLLDHKLNVSVHHSDREANGLMKETVQEKMAAATTTLTAKTKLPGCMAKLVTGSMTVAKV